VSAEKALPDPAGVSPNTPDVIGIELADPVFNPGRRFFCVTVGPPRREPFRRTGEHGWKPFGAVASIPDRMLFRFGALVIMNRPDHPPVPLLFAAFIDDFVKHVVQVVECVHDLAYIRGLELVHLRAAHGVNPTAEGIGDFDFGSLNIVGRVEGMGAPGPAVVGAATAVAVEQAPALEQHHTHVNPTVSRRLDSRAEPLEIRGVKLSQIESRFAVQSSAWAGSRPRQRCGVMDEILSQGTIGAGVPGR